MIRILAPSIMDSADEVKPLAFFSSPAGRLELYWWNEFRTVVIHKSSNNHWYQQRDGNIHDTLRALMCFYPSEPGTLRTSHMLYTTPNDNCDFKEFDADMTAGFFECDWSDFACDGMVIHGNLDIAYPEPLAQQPPASEPAVAALALAQQQLRHPRRTRHI
jgi:hypothetical protein